MSNIKFRVWDGKNYHYPDCGENKTNHYLQIGSDGAFFLHNAKGVFITSSFIGGVLELFTGLQDKNKNDIYDGDKVLYDDIVGVVFFDVNNAMFMVRFEYTRSVYSFDNLERDLEIIGNIHDKESN